MSTATTTIPPLSQSREALMACPVLYRIRIVEGQDMPGNEPADRGTEIHRVIAKYVNHLVATRQTSDWAKFDELAKGVQLEAGEILDDFKAVFVIDPDKVLDTELWLGLDEDLNPVDSRDDAAYEGTLDLVLIHSRTEAEIPDWKSYYQVVPADTFQSKLYPLLLFKHNPALEKIVFRLEFVRYGVGRQVEYTRADVPALEKLVRAQRARQLELHSGEYDIANGELLARQARPGSHCLYCPLLRQNKCPLGSANPYEMSAEDRLRWQLYLQQALKENTALLQDHAAHIGPIQTTDANGRKYEAAFGPSESTKYFLNSTLPVLSDWTAKTGEDITQKLVIGSTELKPLAKAKKRAELAAALEQVAVKTGGTRFRVGKVGDEEDE